MFIKSEKTLKRQIAGLLVIDVQTKILDVMYEKVILVENLLKLIKGSWTLKIPIYYTEQYPQGLGPTLPAIKSALGAIEPIQKMSFSCGSEPKIFETLKDGGISQVVVCGIESHVCVQETVLDLLANNFTVAVAADCVSSRRKSDVEIALRRMQFNGAEITVSESILFELLGVCGTDEFKAVLKILK